MPAEEERFFRPYCGSSFLREAATTFAEAPHAQNQTAAARANGNTPQSAEQHSILFDLEIIGSTLVRYGGNAATVTIPDGVTCIDQEAFAFNTTLQTVLIPDSVTTICERAFDLCSPLRRMCQHNARIRSIHSRNLPR